MTPREYEQYVAKVISELECWKDAAVFRNRLYPGVRQPGSYEIDIAVELMLDGKLFFRLIVECKNWKRVVTRPVVQALAQTRDAIAAHKAAIASPVGFSKEAVAVAAVHGIALWVIAHNIPWMIVMACRSLFGGLQREDYFSLKLGFLEACGFRATAGRSALVVPNCIISSVDPRAQSVVERDPGVFVRPISAGSAIPWWTYHPFFDNESALKSLIDWILAAGGYERFLDSAELRGSISMWKRETRRQLALKVNASGVELALTKVMCGDLEGFLEIPGQKRLSLGPLVLGATDLEADD